MMPPTITREMKVPAAPQRRRGLRPILSMRKRAGRVERVLTMPGGGLVVVDGDEVPAYRKHQLQAALT